ncbi:basic-leucine zipper transcription factor A isoform X5 [Drosophila navojoa]|uniref:basic-leucine zipper transcription factor A isoform X5 n=1 Tax=Drosophila navojoa TaxID=7232 RepID=UPI0011BF8DDA|nr:basic-leucine zipper transcription factor A isoform X5 [Drosophila navojoa]
MLPQFTVYAKIIYLLMVVISGALCTVEDYVIMSQCAHNKAIHLAAEGTVSVTDISQIQNITIVGLTDYVNNEFKIALFAKETQRYLCFNDNWRLVGMKELRDTCYFNETIVHGYFVFRSVVDLQRRVGFTHRGKPVGPKKSVNDACYMFNKIDAEQFFHQHTLPKWRETTAMMANGSSSNQSGNYRKVSRNKNNRHKSNNQNQKLQQQQHAHHGHNSSNSLSSTNKTQQQQLALVRNQQQQMQQQQHRQQHQVRHHHNDPSVLARRKQRRKQQQQQQRVTASPTKLTTAKSSTSTTSAAATAAAATATTTPTTTSGTTTVTTKSDLAMSTHKLSRHRGINSSASPSEQRQQLLRDSNGKQQQQLQLHKLFRPATVVTTSSTQLLTSLATAAAEPKTVTAAAAAAAATVVVVATPQQHIADKLFSVYKNINSNPKNTLTETTPTPTATARAPARARTTATIATTATTKKSLRKSTQKLLATPYHQLTYVRNEAGDIDIDNLDNISVYPDVFEDILNDNDDSSSNSSTTNSNSRLTFVSGFLATSPTSVLPESIRIAKIKINNERRRLQERSQRPLRSFA